MNYKAINNTILNKVSLPQEVRQDKEFYNYLLQNNVSYYFSKQLAKPKIDYDMKIITSGESLNERYLKTLKLIDTICKKNHIKCLLFKTYKYIPEVVDNDVDLIVRENDFYKFIAACKENDFDCTEESNLKYRCIKKGYCKIEPRVNAEIHGIEIINKETIWKNSEIFRVNGTKMKKASKEIDVAYQLLSILYNPKYLRLYLLKVYRDIDKRKLVNVTNKAIRRDLHFLQVKLLDNDLSNKRFPLFMRNVNFVLWWNERIIPSSSMKFRAKLKLLLYFFYSKYNYLIFNTLVFQHKWPHLDS